MVKEERKKEKIYRENMTEVNGPAKYPKSTEKKNKIFFSNINKDKNVE